MTDVLKALGSVDGVCAVFEDILFFFICI